MSQLSEEVLLKETGQLMPGSEHTFLGRRLRHNGDSIDVCMSQKYIDAILDLYGMKDGYDWDADHQQDCPRHATES